MRPVNKSPDRGTFAKYQDAQQPLKDLLGEYCSYCERWIASGVHVEHKKPKKEYKEDERKWSNLLLACGNCNSGKGHGEIELSDYLWPDTDNTFLAFQYDAEGRVIPRSGLANGLDEKVRATWVFLGLNRHEDTFSIPGMEGVSEKDDRWAHRRSAWQKASKLKAGLSVNDTPQRRDEIVEMALERGMFSVWMSVFCDDQDMRKRLILAFPGMAKDCFDAQGNAVQRPGGQL